jgi:hypothetical protein
MIKKFQRDSPRTCLQIGAVKMDDLEVGGDFKIFSIGGSVESAMAANVSIMRLKSPPTSRSSILTAPIWRQVLGLSLWNFLIILFLYVFGPYIGGLESFNYYGIKHNESDPGDCYFEDAERIKRI